MSGCPQPEPTGEVSLRASALLRASASHRPAAPPPYLAWILYPKPSAWRHACPSAVASPQRWLG